MVAEFAQGGAVNTGDWNCTRWYSKHWWQELRKVVRITMVTEFAQGGTVNTGDRNCVRNAP